MNDLVNCSSKLAYVAWRFWLDALSNLRAVESRETARRLGQKQLALFCVLIKGQLCLFDDNLASTIILGSLSKEVDYGIENGSKAIALD